MRPLILWAISFSLLSAVSALAQSQSFPMEGVGSLRVDPPRDWIVLEKRLQAPLLLAGPMPEGQRFRAVIQFFSVEGLEPKDLFEAMAENGDEYRKAKDAWVAGKGGKVLEYSEPKKEKWLHLREVRKFSVVYDLNGNRFEESSYYFSCRGKGMHVKALLPGDSPRKAREEAAQILHSVSCE